MKQSIDMVREFHTNMGAPVGDKPQMLTLERKRLRLALILEEVAELADALGCSDRLLDRIKSAHTLCTADRFDFEDCLIDAADALADTKYVIDGCALEMGIPLDAVTAEVHRSNMTKMPGNMRADGKILKGESYSPPDIASVLGVAK